MKKILIQLKLDTNMNGWTASIAKEFAPKGAKSALLIAESEIYNTKQQAWKTIEKQASEMDYTNNEVYFNHQPVKSYNDVLTNVAAL